MKKRISLFVILLATIFMWSCDSDKKSKSTNKFGNPTIVKIHDLADRGEADSLILFLQHDTTKYRLEAAYVCASITDSVVVSPLLVMLQDPDLLVRAQAAYALGQNPHTDPSNLLWAFKREEDSETKVNLLEALGKTISLVEGEGLKKELIPEYRNFFMDLPTNTEAQQRGLGQALYWLHYRGLLDENIVGRIPFALQTALGEGKMSLAQAMSRYRDPSWFAKNEKYIFNWLKSERSAEVRIFLIPMIGAIGNDEAKRTLLAYASSRSEDIRIRQAALINVGRCTTISSLDLSPFVEDENEGLAQIAVQTLNNRVTKEEAAAIANKCERRGAQLYALSLKLLESVAHGEGYTRMKSQLANTTGYEAVFFISALGSYQGDEDVLSEIITGIEKSEFNYYKTAYAEALSSYVHSKDKMDIAQLTQLFEWLTASFENLDPGVQASIAALIYEDGSIIKQAFADPNFLKLSLTKLSLPREIETYNEVSRAISAIDRSTFEPKKLEFNHPINWSHVQSLGKKIRARVSTNKGDIVIELDVENSPGSVSNFIALVDSGFYNQKFFHRVVPNFVIQTGCPRGDGFGGTDYTIRSEFGLHRYSTGAVGLASAGKDTESCQWFITHLPTPHLEGRYTIIGYVVGGMQTVDKIVMGDKIKEITLEYL